MIPVVVCQDWERLHAALWDIQAYWNTLERKRKQLEEEEEETVQMVGPVVRNTLPQGIRHIQVDLQDLMGQVRGQVIPVFILIASLCFSITPTPEKNGGFLHRWATFRARSWNWLHLQETKLWPATATRKQCGTDESTVTSFWGISAFTSQGWQRTSGCWLSKLFKNTYDSALKQRKQERAHWKHQNASKRPQTVVTLTTVALMLFLEIIYCWTFWGISQSFHLSSNGCDRDKTSQHPVFTCVNYCTFQIFFY